MKILESKILTFQGEIIKMITDILVDTLKSFQKTILEDQFEFTKKSVNEYFKTSIKNKEDLLKNHNELVTKRLEKINKNYFS